jgi:hypothetical protein
MWLFSSVGLLLVMRHLRLHRGFLHNFARSVAVGGRGTTAK